MTNTIKTLVAAAAALSFAGTAIAQDDVTTTFSYDPAASIEANYSDIRETASKACDQMHLRRTTSYTSAYNRLKKDCRANMIEAAVEAINDPFLTALHEGRSVETTTFASAD